MISELARGDYEDMKAQGLSPTLDDFDRLNQLALKLTDGAETTCANFPRVGWAGDVPFFEPTLAAFAWYHSFAVRTAANVETENTLWAFALAHARDARLFADLTTPEAIDAAVSKWAAALPVTRDEVLRACRYAVTGFDDAKPAANDAKPSQDVARRASTSAAAENLARVEEQLRDACARLKCAPDALMGETQSRIAAICDAAAVELGRPMSRDESRLRAAYDLTHREILRRLIAEKSPSPDGQAAPGQ